MPIDINLLRVDAGGDPEKVKKSERDRFRDDSIVDQIIEIDNKWRKCKFIIPNIHS
jgi:seryl-tRNA synthetase